MADIASASYVKYIGTAHVREIDVEGWRDSSVDGDQGFRWHKGNGWAVPADHFTDAQLDYFTRDPDFVIADVEVPRVD